VGSNILVRHGWDMADLDLVRSGTFQLPFALLVGGSQVGDEAGEPRDRKEDVHARPQPTPPRGVVRMTSP
jgi:hypothetical protein